MDSTNSPKASIVMATYNRANYLSNCLESLAALDVDPGLFEILVIDNNSSDNTQEVVQDFAETYPTICVRYLFEDRQGASIARNYGISQTRGEIVLFLDDDTRVYPEWMDAILSGFNDPNVGCIGGPAILDYQGKERPPWLMGDLQSLLSGYGLPYDLPTVITRDVEYPFLCNIAVRKTVLERVGFFRLDLGPTGNNLVVGEETELMDRIRKAGWRILYLPDAGVFHLVSPERMEKKYIYRMGKRMAVTHIYLTWYRRIDKVLSWFAFDFLFAALMFLRFCFAVVTRKPLWFDDYMRFWMISKRVPLRMKALLFGKDFIALPDSKDLGDVK